MVLIFAGDEQHISSIKSLIEVLTSATLAIFQRGCKGVQRHDIWFFLYHCLVSWCVYCSGPRDHPDIAESFMQLHAQVGWIHPSIFTHQKSNPCLNTRVFLTSRFLKGSLICTCLSSWMLKLCFTVVSIITWLHTVSNVGKPLFEDQWVLNYIKMVIIMQVMTSMEEFYLDISFVICTQNAGSAFLTCS